MAPAETPLVTALARTLVGHPWKVVLLAAVCSAVGGWLAWDRLRLETDRMALIGEQHEYNKRFTQLLEEFGDVDAMVVVLWAPDDARVKAAVNTLAERIRARPDDLPELFYRLPTEVPRGKALLFLETKDLREVEARLRAGTPVVSALFREGLGGFFSKAADQVRDGEGLSDDPEQARRALGILRSFTGSLESVLAGKESAAEPWEAFAPSSAFAARDGYLWTEDHRIVLLVQPNRTHDLEGEARSVAVLRELLDAIQREVPGLQAGLTGEPVLEVDELTNFRHDAGLATLASLTGVIVLFVLAFWRLLGPVLATGALCVAVLCTLGFASLWPGHLNLISAAFCALLVGLGIDYGIHLISRYDEERERGLEAEEALRGALSRTGQAIAGGAFTTALAFLATLFTDVQGIREFGVVAGVGIVFCMISSLVVLPALVVLADRGRGGRTGRPRSLWARSRAAFALDRWIEERPGVTVAACLLLAGLGVAIALSPASDGAPRLRYDPNLLDLQPQNLESVRLAREVLDDPGLGGMFAAVVVRDRAQLAQVERAVRALPVVAKTESILDVVRDQPTKLPLLAKIASRVETLGAREAPAEAGDATQLSRLARGAEALAAALEDAARATVRDGDADAAAEILALQERLEALASAAAEPERAARLADYERSLCSGLNTALARLAEECATQEIRDEELPVEVRERFVGKSGAYLMRVYPREDIWQEANLARFVGELQRVVPDVGGVPVQFYESDRLLRRGYQHAGLIAFAFVVFYLVVHFRSLLRPLVATATVFVGGCWWVGSLSVLGIEVNPANLLAIPLTLGIGIDYAIHLVHRDREARQFPSLAGAPAVLATSTGRAVLLSALTTLVGFGALCLSSHRGVASIGWTLCLAIVVSLAAATLFCPALLRLLSGPAQPLVFEGVPGPKTGPGGLPVRPRQDPPDADR